MKKYRPPEICTTKIGDLSKAYQRREQEDSQYRQYRFEEIFEEILQKAYPKKNFQPINEWLNKLKKKPEDWESIFSTHGITIKVDKNIKADYPTEILIGGVYTNEIINLELTENWQEIFSSRKIFEAFASTVRAMSAHEMYRPHYNQVASNIEVEAYSVQVGQYCIDLGFTAGVSLEKLANDTNRRLLSEDFVNRLDSDILDKYYEVIINFTAEKRFLRMVYDYIVINFKEYPEQEWDLSDYYMNKASEKLLEEIMKEDDLLSNI